MRKASTRLPEQGTQTPYPAPDLIPAKHQLRTYMAIGTANGSTSHAIPGIRYGPGSLQIRKPERGLKIFLNPLGGGGG